MIDDGVLSRLANIAIIQNNVQRVLGYGRGVIDRKKLHALQKKCEALDLEFVDLILEVGSAGDQAQEDLEIAAKVQRAKAELARKNQVKTTVEKTDGAVVVAPPADVPEHVKKTTKPRKKVTRRAKAKDATPTEE